MPTLARCLRGACACFIATLPLLAAADIAPNAAQPGVGARGDFGRAGARATRQSSAVPEPGTLALAAVLLSVAVTLGLRKPPLGEDEGGGEVMPRSMPTTGPETGAWA